MSKLKSIWRLAPWGLACLSFLAVTPRLMTLGTNVVTQTYAQGSERLFADSSPYTTPSGGLDYFKYSPLFAVLYRPIAALPPIAEALFWAALNIFFFWWGLSRWWPEKFSPLLALATLATAAELNISLLYQQVNAFLIGCVLLALSFCREKKFIPAAFLLAFISNLKIFPVFFVLGLIPFAPHVFLLSFAVASLLFLILPSVIVGIHNNYLFHTDWINLLRRDGASPGIADLASLLRAWGSSLGWIPALIIGVTTPLLIWKKKPEWPLFFAALSTTILLISPRTESPTFVIAAPSYILLMNYFSREMAEGRRAQNLLILSFFLISLFYTDLSPFPVWPNSPPFAPKVVGTLLLWALSAAALKGWGAYLLPGREGNR